METRKLLIFIFCALFCLSGTTAQTYYYKTTKTFNENGYTYQCDVSVRGKFTVLYNKSNKYTYTDMTYKNGTRIGDNDIPLLEVDTWTKTKSYSIVNESFTSAEKQRLKALGFTVTMYIDSTTGKVIEVDFRFGNIHGAGTIPIYVYRRIELDLKNQIWFTPTAEGKKMNYLMRAWVHEVK